MSYARTTANFAQPATDAYVTVGVTDTSWMTPNLPVYCDNGGYYLVNNIVSSVSVILQNLGYTGNAVAGTAITFNSKIVPAGLRGAAGTDTSVNKIYYNASDPNGVVTAERPAMCYCADGTLWAKTNTGSNATGWSQIL